jgi:hypothetical protein
MRSVHFFSLAIAIFSKMFSDNCVQAHLAAPLLRALASKGYSC